jgi:hypothetical protein
VVKIFVDERGKIVDGDAINAVDRCKAALVVFDSGGVSP